MSSCRQLKEDFPLIDADAASTLVPTFPESEEQLLVRTAEVCASRCRVVACRRWVTCMGATCATVARHQAAQRISDRYYPEHVLFVSHAPVNLGTPLRCGCARAPSAIA